MSEVPQLGRLASVLLRDIWATEDRHFTPWLAKPENLSLLAQTLRLGEIEVEGIEVPVGDFRIDILARDRDNRIVVIENQFGKTDHTHLGQTLTYIAGQEGQATAIWIAEIIREEHRAAIDWLNASTIDGFDFFAVKLDAVRIGESMPAPLFSVVAKPNNWSRGIARAAQVNSAPGTLTDVQKSYIDYWSRFIGFLEDKNAPYKPTSIPKGDWCGFGHIAHGCSLVVQSSLTQPKRIVEIYFGNPKSAAVYLMLLKDRGPIDEAFAGSLSWRPSGKAYHIEINNPALSAASEDEQFNWFLDNLNNLSQFFRQKIQQLPLDATSAEDAMPEAAEAGEN